MPRKPRCTCGACPLCLQRITAREAYQAMTPDERRAWVARRDAVKVRAADRARYQRDHDKRRAAQDAYAQTEAGKAALKRGKARWAKTNPEKRRAQNAVSNALRSGRLVKGSCALTGPDCHGRIEAHHPDYSEPLTVFWLCHKHHADQRASLD